MTKDETWNLADFSNTLDELTKRREEEEKAQARQLMTQLKESLRNEILCRMKPKID